MNVIYIAGPITGVKNAHVQFNEVAKTLRDAGFQVINPAELPVGMTEFQYMDICCAYVRSCDAILMLDGWESSEGANIEHMLARKNQKRIYKKSQLPLILTRQLMHDKRG